MLKQTTFNQSRNKENNKIHDDKFWNNGLLLIRDNFNKIKSLSLQKKPLKPNELINHTHTIDIIHSQRIFIR